MALATIVNCVVLIAVPHFGQSMVVLAWALWWVDVAITILASFGIPFIMCARRIHVMSACHNNDRSCALCSSALYVWSRACKWAGSSMFRGLMGPFVLSFAKPIHTTSFMARLEVHMKAHGRCLAATACLGTVTVVRVTLTHVCVASTLSPPSCCQLCPRRMLSYSKQ